MAYAPWHLYPELGQDKHAFIVPKGFEFSLDTEMLQPLSENYRGVPPAFKPPMWAVMSTPAA